MQADKAVIQEAIQKRTEELEKEFRQQFEGLKDNLYSRLESYISESIVKTPKVDPELKAQVDTYKPIVEAIMKALKDNGVLNQSSHVESEVDPAIIEVITEQTSVINAQDKKLKELKMRVKLHEMITNNLSGLNKDIVKEAINKFQGAEELNEEDLLKELTNFVNKRKGGQKEVQFESIAYDLDEVDSILEGASKTKEFRPNKKIDIKGLKKRVVSEATGVNLDEDNPRDNGPADEFMRDFGHLS